MKSLSNKHVQLPAYFRKPSQKWSKQISYDPASLTEPLAFSVPRHAFPFVRLGELLLLLLLLRLGECNDASGSPFGWKFYKIGLCLRVGFVADTGVDRINSPEPLCSLLERELR